jgi:glycosyltransferase involved in cell wall biosynthesis
MKENQCPLVSVSVITYQHGKFIKQCLDSILSQVTSFDFEILLGEDGSTDGTREVCMDYAKKYPDKIKLFLHDQNGRDQKNGISRAKLNFINNLEQAKGKYIALCEGDDYWTDSNKLQRQAEFLEHNPDYVLCWTRFKKLNDKTGELSLDNNGSYFYNEEGIDFDFEIFYKGWDIGTQTLMFKKNTLLENNNFNNKYYKDIFLISDLLTVGKGYCLNDVMAVYRMHAGGIYSSTNEITRAETGALTYREIYITYSNNKYLELKFQKFNDFYIRYLLNNKLYKKALLTIDQLTKLNTISLEYREELFKHIEELLLQKDIQLKQKDERLHHIYNSGSFKMGRVITMPARWIFQLPNKISSLIIKLAPKAVKNKIELKKMGVIFIDKKKIIKNSKNLKPLPSSSVEHHPRLIVSLTSFPKRIPEIFFNLYSLLNQTTKPDILILWLGEEQFPHKENDLPTRVLDLKNYGLTIKWCKDIKAYTKLIYSIKEYANDIIVTADDDIYYPENWLELLYNSYLREPQYIHCHRAHRITFDNVGNIDYYKKWFWCISGHEASFLNFLTGVGGVLYPPDCLYKDVLNEELFMKLSPMNDDIWFWVMAVMNNTKIRVVDNNITEFILIDPEVEFGMKDGITLYKTNKYANDEQLKNVIDFYKDKNFYNIIKEESDNTLTKCNLIKSN